MKLEDIRKLCDDATPPDRWEVTIDGPDDGRFENATGPWHDQMNGDNNRAHQDAQFIAASRTLLPKLLAVAEAAKASENATISKEPSPPWSPTHESSDRCGCISLVCMY